MQKNLVKFMQSVVFFPVLMTSLATVPLVGGVAGSPTAAAIISEQNRTLSAAVAPNQEHDLDVKAQKIDSFLSKRNSPLVGKGREFVLAAEENDLPWPVLVAIATRESSAGIHACKNDPSNVFGFDSCRHDNFDSVDEAINYVAKTISGNDPKTAKWYQGKDLTTVLEVYNGRAVPHYAKEVIHIMDSIEQQPVPQSETA